MHWRIKGLIQKTLGVLPGGHPLHHRLQRRFGGLHKFRQELAGKVNDWTLMVGHLRDAGAAIPGSHLFEIGTGWYPTFPFACHLAGARRVSTFDLSRHLQPDLVRSCVDELGGFIEVIAQAAGVAPDEVRERHARLRAGIAREVDLESASDGVIVYAAPADATRTALADGSVDVVFSNSVLEHVPPEVIVAMHRESLRVLAPGGLVFHSVNCGDHYAYVDRDIHQLNYLQYSDRAWKFWNNAFLYQNRMRAHEFVAAAAAEGFEIVLNTANTRAERLRQLAAMKVHPQFAHVPAEKLCITTVDFIGRKPKRQSQAA